MAVLKVKDIEIELKFSIMLDKVLNKVIKDDDEIKDKKGGRERLSGGLQKVLPELIEQDVETLAIVFEQAHKLSPNGRTKITQDDILQAIDDRMDEDDDATVIFKEVFEAIDASAFSRKQLEKFAENMKLVKVLRSDELDDSKAELMLSRMNNGFMEITGRNLIEEGETTSA